MTVKVTKVNYILVGRTKLIPNRDAITLTPGELIKANVTVCNDSYILPALPGKAVYAGFSPLGSYRWSEIKVGETPGLANRPALNSCADVEYEFRIPSLQQGNYLMGFRTEEQGSYEVTFEIAVEPPITPGLARIEVWSQPLGAKAFIDGSYVGKTPVAKDVAPGYHDIKVELEGYKVKDIIGAERVDSTARISVTSGQRARVTFVMEPYTPLWKSAAFWGAVGVGVGTLIFLKKRKQIMPYVRRGIEVARPYVRTGVELARRGTELVRRALR